MISVAAAAIWAAWIGWTSWAGHIDGLAGFQPGGEVPDLDQPQSEAKPIDTSRGSGAPSLTARATLDEAVFEARLWVAPLRPSETLAAKAPEPPAPPPPPFKMRLVGLQHGISSEESVAMVYDPDAFKVARVVPGGSIGRYRLEHLHVAKGEAVFTDTQHPGKPRHALVLATLMAPRTSVKSMRSPVNDGGAP
jgi:hypothetical protein